MKKYKLFFTPEAIQETKDVVTWYEEQQKGLGRRFKRLLKKELDTIRQNPFSRSIRYDSVRFAITPVFPYAAHYTVDESTRLVIILAVLGFKQDP
ncbi:MAG TPA: type II toxin-antitoxin system RelE/ParE family toxin, partial [Chitinophagaceae bacterium]